MNSAPDPAPDTFGPYEVYERLGMGGMAMVHRAKKRGIEGFERSVALKRIITHLAEDRNFVESFIREAKVSSLLHHANIAQVYDFGRIGGVYYIAMELVQGFDIRKLLRYANKSGEPIPMPVLLSILGEMAEALDYAHSFVDEHGQHLHIVHRDVSPSNLIVAHSGHLKVIDFGIAKASSVQLHTESGQVKGKLGYMSPEAALGMQLEPVSDIFSMGVVAWELVTAAPLFSARTDFETMQRIRDADIPPPSYYNPNCPPELDSIILSALERDSRRRLPSAGVFRAAIDALATQHGIHHSARQVAEWLTRFAQPGDQWVRTSAQRQLPPQEVSSRGRSSTAAPPARPTVKLQRSQAQAQLAQEIWGEDPGNAVTAAAPDFSMSSPLTDSVPPLVQPHQSQPYASQPHHSQPHVAQVAQSQPIAPMYTPTHHPQLQASPKPKKAIWILAALAIVAGVLAALLVVKRMQAEPTPPTVTRGPVHFVVEPAGAAIEIAGQPVASDVELAAGEHVVTVKRDGYKPWSRSITVRAGESQTVNVSLERGMAHVTLESDPEGLAIAIDGKPSGYRTPASFDLPAGTHELAIEHGGETWREQLVATVDGKHALRAKLGGAPAVAVAVPSEPKPLPKDRRKPKAEVAEVKPPPVEVKPPPPPVEVKPPPPVEVKPPPPKPQDTRTPVVAAGAVTKLSGEIPKLKSAGGESNGDALVKMCIDTSGKVTSVKVVKSPGSIASELQAALTSWRYKPYTNAAGQPSAVCFPVQLRLVFRRAD